MPLAPARFGMTRTASEPISASSTRNLLMRFLSLGLWSLAVHDRLDDGGRDRNGRGADLRLRLGDRDPLRSRPLLRSCIACLYVRVCRALESDPPLSGAQLADGPNVFLQAAGGDSNLDYLSQRRGR